MNPKKTRTQWSSRRGVTLIELMEFLTFLGLITAAVMAMAPSSPDSASAGAHKVDDASHAERRP